MSGDSPPEDGSADDGDPEDRPREAAGDAGAEPTGDDTGDAGDGGGDEAGGDPGDGDEPLGDLAEAVPDGSAGAGTGGEDDGTRKRDGPLSEVADELDADAVESSESPAEQLFEEVDEVGEIDRQALWRQVAGEDAATRIDEVDEGPGGGPDGPTVRRPDESATDPVDVEDREVRVVEKAKYCEGCEYFSAPPDVHCTHEGTDILEMIDVKHFRVADCPIVAEDEELENV